MCVSVGRLTLCHRSPGTGIHHVSLSEEQDSDSSPKLLYTGPSSDLNNGGCITTRERAA